MKKITLLKSLLVVMALSLFSFSVWGVEKTISFTFSDYTAGTQYAAGEEHKIDDVLTLYTTACHFTTQLRIYSSSTNNGYVVSNKLPGAITAMTFNAGNKADNLLIFGSNDGASWAQMGSVAVTSSYKDYSVTLSGNYTYFKLDVEGENQVRIASMSVTYDDAISGGEGGDEVVPEPEEPGSGFIGEYTHTFASGELSNGSVTLSEVVWNFAMEGSTFFGWDNNNGRGLQMGKKDNPATSIVLSSSAFAGKVTKVVVNTSGASGVDTDLSVAVGGVLLSPENARLTTIATDYAFTGEASGEIVITWTNKGKGLYIKSLSVVTEAGTVEAPTVVKPLFSVASKKFSEPFNLTLSCATEGAEIYYTFEEAGEFVKYTEHLNITETTTVYAKAVLGEEESEVASATYTYVNPVVTIAEFLAAEVNDGILYELTGVVSNITNTTYGNFDIIDETGTVLVYGLRASETAGNQTFAQIEDLDEGDTLTLRGYRSAYNSKAQVGSAYYVSHEDAAQVVELPEVDNIAALVSLGEKARITGAITVVAQTGKYLWVKDASMSMLVYGDAPTTYNNGDQLTGLVATVSSYNGATQLTPVEFPEAVAGTVVEPAVMALADVTTETVHQYIKLEGVTYTDATTLTDGENTLAMYDHFKYTYAGAEGDKVDVIAIAGLYNENVQVYPISIEKVKNGGVTTGVEVVDFVEIFVQNRTIVAEGEFQIFTITGQNVTNMNGNLENGVYVVRSANAVGKVVVK